MTGDGVDIDALVGRLRAAGCVFAEEEARLLVEAASSPAELDDLARRRESGLPLEHVVGWVAFRGLRIPVDPGVFVPRRRTELLVDEAARLLTSTSADRARRAPGVPLVVVDLCCGCGALGFALAHELRATGGDGAVELHAADVDPVAVRCARRVVAQVGGRAYLGDLYDALPASLRGRVDVLLANVPYVPGTAIALMPPEARLHEPRTALDGGPDGLAVLRRVAAEAASWLAPGGHLLVETGDDQVAAALDSFREAGLAARAAGTDEETGEATAVIGTRPAT